MKISLNLLLAVFSFLLLNSCSKKKYTEVVEVPLPRIEEKAIIGNPEDINAEEGAFKVDKLDFKYDALVPTIDALTLELSYSKHYLAYTNALNKAVLATEFEKSTIEEILAKVDNTNLKLKNCAGAYFNYNLFWKSVGLKSTHLISDSLAVAINKNFETFAFFRKQFISQANSHVGSGWIWLIADSNGKLQIITTFNNENPLLSDALIKGRPLLTINLWEHAYYLNYKQKRNEYIEAIFKIINWKNASANFELLSNK